MSKKVTVFKLLAAGPNDILPSARMAIDLIVQEWNRTQGEYSNMRVEVVDWSTHTFPQYGKRPQHFINRQAADHCDLVVALFWQRFGAPTGVAQSGTEEEICRAIKRRVPVMLYFSTKNARRSPVDPVQYQRVLRFKNRHRKKGLYKTFQTPEEFMMQFRIHFSDMMIEVRRREARRKRRRR
jgi:hypothetical protein